MRNSTPGAWRGIIRRAIEIAKVKRKNTSHQRGWHRSVIGPLQDAGFSIKSTQQLLPPLPGQPHTCHTCQMSFPTLQQLATHRYDKHQGKHISRYYAAGTVCQARMGQHHTRTRLITHLRNNEAPKCLQAYVHYFPTLPQEEVDRLDQKEAQRHRQAKWKGAYDAKSSLPHRYLPGPKLPPPAPVQPATPRRASLVNSASRKRSIPSVQVSGPHRAPRPDPFAAAH